MLKSFQKLGGSAGIPTPDRGVTSLIISEEKYDIMVDCGEGTYLNWIKAGYKWKRLKYILITHMHPDHTSGLIPLIFYRNILRIEPKLTIYGPPYLEEYVLQSLQYQAVNLKFELEILSIENYPKINLENNILAKTTHLKHKIPCWGFRVEDEELLKLEQKYNFIRLQHNQKLII